jgi:quinol monooxygenase YgiN
MPDSYFQVIAHYHVRPGEIRTVIDALHQLAKASRTEPANLGYDFFQDLNDPDHLVILERYTDEAGLDAHRESEHFRTIGVGQIIPRLAERRIESYLGSNS